MSYDRTQVDLTNCDREPIHVPGAIQPHGALMVVDPASFLVSHVSANIGDYLKIPAADCVGIDVVDLIGSEVTHDIRNAVAGAGLRGVAAVLLKTSMGSGLNPVDITVHQFEGRLFLELEPTASSDDTEVALHLTQSLVKRIDGETELDPLLRSVSRLVRAMLGYDRVMVYRFLHNGAGRVVSEARASHLQSFLGQHFPAGDIPVQARRLYIQNWTRVIGNVGFIPVPLMPALAQGEEPIDMSHAHLRSVSPIHCEYLANMGIAASVSLSIVVDGRLWGLIACHHDSPKTLSIPLRVSVELFAQYLSLHIAAIEHRVAKTAAGATRSKLDAIVADVDRTVSVETTLRAKLREFSALVDCDGAALWARGQWSSVGDVPTANDVPDVIDVVRKKAKSEIWQSQSLKSLLPQTPSIGEQVAGILAIPLSPVAENYLLFFRSEEAHEIEWAGEPVKKTVSTPNGDRLTPRGSFDAWREEVRHQSVPWTDADISIAESVRSYVRDFLIRHNDATEEFREKRESDRALLNAELNHRVKNILALVKSIASQTGANALSVDDYASSFEGRLRALSYAHDQSFAGRDGGELRPLIEAEAGMHRFSNLPDRISLSGPPVGLSERAFGVFALLLQEMMTNAAKYGSLSKPGGQLDVQWYVDENGNCLIDWTEEGGPVVARPSRKGFGSSLIEKTIAHDLGGEVELRFEPSGLMAHFVVPAEHLREALQPTAMDADDQVVAHPLSGLKVLLVEDQALIAMDTEEQIRSLGARDVMVCANVNSALEAIGVFEPDCGVLDLNLGSETSEMIALALNERGVPYVFATGYRDSVSIPDAFSAIPVVRKPISNDSLSRQVSKAIDLLSTAS